MEFQENRPELNSVPIINQTCHEMESRIPTLSESAIPFLSCGFEHVYYCFDMAAHCTTTSNKTMDLLFPVDSDTIK